MKAPSRRDRIRAQLADLKMPGALEALDQILSGIDGGTLGAPEGARIKGCVKERRCTFPLTINQRVPGCHPGDRNVAS